MHHACERAYVQAFTQQLEQQRLKTAEMYAHNYEDSLDRRRPECLQVESVNESFLCSLGNQRA